MTESELAFLEQKKATDLPRFKRVVRILSIVFIIIPIIGAILSELNKYFNRNASEELRKRLEEESPLSGYLIAIVIVIFLIFIIVYIGYKRTIGRLQHDIQNKQKIIEQAEINRKLHVSQNNTYFFFIQSPTKTSIEVNANVYNYFKEGDEINIEYSVYAKVYFGYF